ncbi:unnamed protein product [Parnassius apollo]|uniref:(apollo) hypothetical protein n=1 Tax=Parnassius apollo TaxID=110799 RepID=A0A8S3WJ80_PARAO|nr:unnamed protein product [Parnassius apollo]
MGDRNNPIKFGPEWLRNLAREGNAGGSVNNGPNPTNSGNLPSSGSGSTQGSTTPTGTISLPGPSGVTSAMGSSGNNAVQGAAGGSTSSNINAAAGANSRNSTNSNAPKVLLAKLRYGREEMLALYDRSAEAPEELKYLDLLYQSRGKPPVALNNTFEEEMRDNIRGGPPIGAMAPPERFGIGRGMGRGSTSENRGRTRMPFVRQTSSGRGNSWHGNTRLPGYNNATEEDTNPLRPWGASNGNNSSLRANTEQPEWTSNKVFRRRQANNTNWRQPHTRDEGDEWRSSDAARSHREWGERPIQDRPQSWNSNRRTWVGGEGNNDDNLPEWAVDNAEAGAGTFDSTGAFHGYSNDDSNLPKTQDSSFPLARSHTHGSFARSKPVEEGSEEWWASEKAKKLSPKRFEASDTKFKKSQNAGTSKASTSKTSTQNSKGNVDKDEASHDSPENSEKTATAPEPSENKNTSNDKKLALKSKFSESKTFDSLMRSDIDMEEVREERGNFQSVMITANNSLRQKHQNIVASVSENSSRQGRIPVLQMLHAMQPNDDDCQQIPAKLVEDIFDMNLEDAKISTSCVTSINSNDSSSQADHRLSSVGMPISIPSAGMTNHGLTMSSASTMSTSVLQGAALPTPGMQTGGLHAPGMQTVGLQTGVIQSGVMQSGSMQPGGMQQGGMQPGGLQSGGMQPSGIQGGILQPGAMQPGGIQALQAAGLQTSMPTPGLQNVGIPNSALNSSLGLSLVSANNGLMLPMQRVQQSAMPSTQLSNSGLGAAGLQARGTVLPGFQPSSGLSVIAGANVANTSLFLGQNNNPMQSTTDLQMQGHGAQTNLFPMHGLQHSNSHRGTFGSIYSNIIPPPPTQPAQTSQNLADQWYYEDPKKIIQGPFSSKEMYNWYRAGFFSPSLMVRRACDTHMRPLGSYGPMVPFAQIDSLWSHPTPSPDLIWMQQAMNARNESRVNNLPMFFWDPQGEHVKEK